MSSGAAHDDRGGRRVLFACDLDSQIFGALPIAAAFRARGWFADFALDEAARDNVPKALVARLEADFSVRVLRLATLATSAEAFDYDAIGVFATGSRLALVRGLLAVASEVRQKPRPALFCGFNGLVFEKFEEGIAWRLGYDAIALNGPRDLETFKDFVRGTPYEGQPAAVTGLRRTAVPAIRTAARGPKRLFVFAEQVVVPRAPFERRSLVATLARLAAASPDWDVVVKGRVAPGEATFHERPAPIERLMSKIPQRPANMTLSYEPLDRLLPRAELFCTVSSTAIFDALDHGVPSLIATDFGMKNVDGAHVFFASGLATRLGDLSSLGEAPTLTPNAQWLERVGYSPAHSPAALVDLIERYDPARPAPPAFASFRSAAKSATERGDFAGALDNAFQALKKSENQSVMALEELGERLEAAIRLAGSGEETDDALARLARKLTLYWAYKKFRRAVGRPLD